MTSDRPATTPYGEWRARHEAAPVTDPLTLIGAGGLVVIAPHPDDESLGAAALITAAALGGRKVGLVALTDGEGSHRGSTEWPAERIAERRRSEQALALRELGAGEAEILRLALPDGASRWHPDFALAADAVAHLVDETGATALAATVGFDPHPDHEAAALLAEAVAALRPGLRILLYPVWSLRHPDDHPVEVEALHPFRLVTPLAEKARALARHETQMGGVVHDDPDGFTLPDWFLRHHQSPFESVFWRRRPGRPPGPEHFAALYAGNGDPWHARTAAYEIAKREAVLAFLGDARFGAALELGCGEGHLTAALAALCDRAHGLDGDAGIVSRATLAHDGVPGLGFTHGRLPADFPAGRYDLVVLSEVLYFLAEPEIEAVLASAAAQCEPGATMLLVNYLGPTDTPLSGDDAADFLIASAAHHWSLERSERAEHYRLDRLTRL
ncbi:bifunctional PIG-L family deacetylase/class I SAM-dependent methyltransferase [Aureimonas sp. AU12]|uniref:bifunctional PIG-L family deacetylase/class I SAM-dependent methyltransferase n=1 Tax=Aureimonas sp. AU12 TaxID=1638161 RepID=UPI00078605FC|nr:bifunctional PIG-L family deacetylase/class I SAM-dependent methyltransferase [Aureimonas sp. AU12]